MRGAYPQYGLRVDTSIRPLTPAPALRTREECIRAAAVHLARCYKILYTYPLEEAVRRAARPGGPTYEELMVLITERREKYLVPARELATS